MTRITTSIGLVRFNIFVNVANPLKATMAANDLTQFYSAVLAVARVVWAPATPQTWRRAAVGGLILMFWSDSPIPWEFLSAFLSTIVSLVLNLLDSALLWNAGECFAADLFYFFSPSSFRFSLLQKCTR